ncbi:LuxR family transcriptional regulator [Saccharothrix mutabilis subsp. mutabilis]|uniref:LuxR family transcriptional regulator n=1 Tax=Saccharothrix mutabilis subsp. mutabilis TaxID=66855 RepID=A0ABN0URG0_9PSEU
MSDRPKLLARVDLALADGVALLNGPRGIGKTTTLNAAVAQAHARGEIVLRANGACTERWIAGQALADLLASCPGEVTADLRALARPARRGTRTQILRRTGFLGLLARLTADQDVLVAIDDVHWIDTVSADVIAHAARRADDRIRFLFAGQDAAAVPCQASWITVPPMTVCEVADLLAPHRVTERTVSQVHVEAAGNPGVALAVCTGQVRGHVEDALATLTATAWDTVLVCALAARPTSTLLHRSGCSDPDADLEDAVECSLVVVEDGAIRFTPPAAAAVVADLAGAAARHHVHRRLARAVTSAAEVQRHRALSHPEPDERLASALITAARSARRSPGFAAELFLMAANRFPPEKPGRRFDALLSAVEVGVGAGVPGVVAEAARAVLAESANPVHRVRARTALVRHAGQSAPGASDLLAAAEADATDDLASQAGVSLWRAYAATVAADPRTADEEAARAVANAQTIGDTITEAYALALRARARRLLRRPGWKACLDEALAVSLPDTAGHMHLTPQHLAARFATYDDQIDEARTILQRLLGVAEQGPMEDLMSPLCGLVEVAVRQGRCTEAMQHARRAVRTAGQAALSPGPGWYVTALAELAGGDLALARFYAEHGVRACTQDGDVVYRLRNLHALGQTLARQGETRQAIEMLREVQRTEAALGHADPTVLRWQPELVLCLVRVGDHLEAERLVSATRELLDGLGARGAGAGLDRVLAFAWAASGRIDEAIDLVRGAATVFAALGQPLEQGRCLLIEAAVHRRRRRYTAAAHSAATALDVFTRIDAVPWARHARAVAARIAAVGSGVQDLTTTERRVAELVAEGATNREIAQHLYVSPKTVEATLTRVYRKLGLRSRAQLARQLDRQS